eukprot:SAG31_NODE_2286_length_6006_cov_4.245810_2_plen_177_part_00
MGKDLVAQLRRADDWYFEGSLCLPDEDSATAPDGPPAPLDDDLLHALFCFQAAHMTHTCHGELWPHLKLQHIASDKLHAAMCSLLAMTGGAAEDAMAAANAAIGIVTPGSVHPAASNKPPRRTGSVDLEGKGLLSRFCATIREIREFRSNREIYGTNREKFTMYRATEVQGNPSRD